MHVRSNPEQGAGILLITFSFTPTFKMNAHTELVTNVMFSACLAFVYIYNIRKANHFHLQKKQQSISITVKSADSQLMN